MRREEDSLSDGSAPFPLIHQSPIDHGALKMLVNEGKVFSRSAHQPGTGQGRTSWNWPIVCLRGSESTGPNLVVHLRWDANLAR